MNLTAEDIKKIAKLSRIAVTEEDVVKFQKDLNSIFPWIEQLSEVNVDGIEPLVGVESQALVMREDIANEQKNIEELMDAAPESKYGYYVVPKVIE